MHCIVVYDNTLILRITIYITYYYILYHYNIYVYYAYIYV